MKGFISIFHNAKFLLVFDVKSKTGEWLAGLFASITRLKALNQQLESMQQQIKTYKHMTII